MLVYFCRSQGRPKNEMRAIIINLLLIGCALAFLVHLCLIAAYGSILIQEPNRAILGLEIAVMVAIIVFGIADLIHRTRR